jgi:hypothetical protein
MAASTTGPQLMSMAVLASGRAPTGEKTQSGAVCGQRGQPERWPNDAHQVLTAARRGPRALNRSEGVTLVAGRTAADTCNRRRGLSAVVGRRPLFVTTGKGVQHAA